MSIVSKGEREEGMNNSFLTRQHKNRATHSEEAVETLGQQLEELVSLPTHSNHCHP